MTLLNALSGKSGLVFSQQHVHCFVYSKQDRLIHRPAGIHLLGAEHHLTESDYQQLIAMGWRRMNHKKFGMNRLILPTGLSREKTKQALVMAQQLLQIK